MTSHLFTSESDGGLYDTRIADWSQRPPLRPVYCRTFFAINTVAEFKATLRNGAYAWPGGYPLFFITSDGGALSFEAARGNFRQIADSIATGANDGWRVVGTEINYEDSDLCCAHTGKPIEAAYAD